MHAVSHLLLSWFFADAMGVEEPRERRFIAWMGVAPDIDSLAYVGAYFYYHFNIIPVFSIHRAVHHRYTHGILFLFWSGVMAYFVSRWCSEPSSSKRYSPLYLPLVTMGAGALHLLCDVLGSGPDWPIYPLWPFSDLRWGWEKSWPLGDWRNTAVLTGLFLASGVSLRWRGRSPLEAVRPALDRLMATRLVRSE